jgi:sugar lactone lactonase YvrE
VAGLGSSYISTTALAQILNSTVAGLGRTYISSAAVTITLSTSAVTTSTLSLYDQTSQNNALIKITSTFLFYNTYLIAGSRVAPCQIIQFGYQPTAPTSLAFSLITQNGFTVGWSGAAGATSYTYALNSIATVPASSTASSASFTSLSAGTAYAVIVYARNQWGITPASANTLTAPGPATSVTIVSVTTVSFIVNWTAAIGATSYSYTLNGSSATPSSSTSTSASFTGLSSSTFYTVIVTAINASGSTASSPVSATTITPASPPSAPNSLSASAVTTSGFTLSWVGGVGATSYTYTLNGSPVTPSQDNGVGGNNAVFSGLSSGTSYNIGVTAVNPSGSTELTAPFTLGSVPGLSLWLDGKDPLNTGAAPSLNADVPTWYDKSGSGYNGTSAGTMNPTYTADGIFFNTAAYYTTSYPTAVATETGFFIVKVVRNNYQYFIAPQTLGTTSQGGRGFMNQNGQFQLLLPPTTTNSLSASSYIVNNTSIMLEYSYTATTYVGNAYYPSLVNLYANGSNAALAQPAGAFVPQNYGGTVIGSYATGIFKSGVYNGSIGEVILFNSTLSTSDRQKVEGYLAWKWGLQAKLPVSHPYYSAAPATAPFTVRTISGTVTTFAGSGSILDVDGVGTSAAIYSPSGICFDNSNNVYVYQYSSRKVRKITPGAVVTTLSVITNIPLTSYSLCYNAARGVLIVVDYGQSRVYSLNTDNSSYTTIAGTTYGNVDGTGTAARFANPYSAVADSAGNTYVTDYTNGNIRKITTGNVVTTFARGILNPAGITIDSAGNLYVCAVGTNDIKKITSGGTVTTFAGQGSIGYVDSPSPLIARFWGPRGITIDNAGNLLVADTSNSVIRKITPAGVVTTYAGLLVASAFINSTLLQSKFNSPYAIAINAANTALYVADYGWKRIRQVYYG